MECFFPIDKIRRNSKVAIYGMGNVGKWLIQWNQRFKYCDIVCAFDKNADLYAKHDIRTDVIENIFEYEFDFLIIAITIEIENVKEIISKLNVDLEKCIYMLDGYVLLNGYSVTSFAQEGEDIILLNLFKRLNMNNISYCDIGANEPYKFSNTYLLENNLLIKKGVLIEANPTLVQILERERKKAVCINRGIVVEANQKTLPFYCFESSTLSTFSQEAAMDYQKKGYPLKEVLQIKCEGINDILCEYFNNELDFLSIDIEGMDGDVIRDINFNQCKPKVICVETSGFYMGKDEDGELLIDYLVQNGYVVYADTFLNSIFVLKEVLDGYCKDVKTVYPLHNEC